MRLPGIEEQRVLEELEISLLLAPSAQERWNQLVVEDHYLHNATLVGEQLRYAAVCTARVASRPSAKWNTWSPAVPPAIWPPKRF